jgi:phosphotransferase system  glucose/maltose/N-acetylglucosamine-specific IIC component
MLLVMGVVFFFVYFLLFSAVIRMFNLKTPGRGQTQTGNTGVNRFQVVRSAHRGDIAGRQLGQAFFGGEAE